MPRRAPLRLARALAALEQIATQTRCVFTDDPWETLGHLYPPGTWDPAVWPWSPAGCPALFPPAQWCPHCTARVALHDIAAP
jgi:hypothetical protein